MQAGLMATLNETRKGLMITWSYRFNNLAELFTLGFVFVGILFFMGNGQIPQERMAETLIGYTTWILAMTAISSMSFALADEANTGTLEQMFMGATDSTLIIVGRAMASMLWNGVQIALLTLALVLLLHISLPLRAAALVPLLLVVIELAGFSFIMAGVTLVFKHVQALSGLLQNLLLFINGALVPVDRLPDWLAWFAKLMPTTYGIVVLRKVMLQGMSLADAWNDGSLMFLTIHAIVFLLLGVLIFKWCERVARRQGTLGQY